MSVLDCDRIEGRDSVGRCSEEIEALIRIVNVLRLKKGIENRKPRLLVLHHRYLR